MLDVRVDWGLIMCPFGGLAWSNFSAKCNWKLQVNIYLRSINISRHLLCLHLLSRKQLIAIIAHLEWLINAIGKYPDMYEIGYMSVCGTV